MQSGTSAIEAAKARLVGAAATLAEAALGATDPARARRYVAEFYEHVPPVDIAGRDPVDLCGAAAALWRLAARRPPGTALVRIYNPRPAADGWSSPRTIAAIVNDDMPFLVDSVHAALSGAGHEVCLVIHPVVSVARDGDGNFAELDPASGGIRESWMLVEIGREPHAAALDALTATIGEALGDVRAAVSDWPAMRATLRSLASGLAARNPPVPQDEIAEAGAFLRWLDDGNFTFLGFRDYPVSGNAGADGPPLGILRDADTPLLGALRDFAALPRDAQHFLRRRELLAVTKTNTRARVHRSARMDAIGIRRFDALGEVAGISVFVGLFTSRAAGTGPRDIPVVRRKLDRIVARAGMAPAGHDGKALLHILDGFPRDELFQIDDDALYDTAIGVLNLQERQRFALFVRRDPLQRFVSCLVYAPRERYDSRLREVFGGILTAAFGGTLWDFYVHLDESPLAQVQFIIRTRGGAVPDVNLAALERKLIEAGRGWTDRLETAAAAAWGEDAARNRLRGLAPFPPAYQARTTPAQAIADLDQVTAILAGSPLEASLHPRAAGQEGGGGYGLRLYRRDDPVVLSDILPVIENLGLRIIAEEPFRIESESGPAVWIDEFTLAAGAVPAKLPEALREKFEAALVAIWLGNIENDGFNRLILAAGLSARQTVILRLYCKVLRQAGSAYSQAYMEETLFRHAAIAGRLVRLFEDRFALDRPSRNDNPAIRAIERALDAVENLDEDRILRNFLTLIRHSLRTNYYQPLPDGTPKPYLSVKLASSRIDLFPLPRPLYEIYVYSPRMEGVHMRAGRVARGGIRWSDRKEDFRREVLGLMKAQTVKNAVIVPVGSKGGFVLKRPPPPGPNLRAQLQAEGIECYKILMRGLLDLTDTIGPGQTIKPPLNVARLDGDDPYLVVAADKGTASFSDFANEIAIEYGFWLGDAFASGGSAGYDHKAIGITSRGAWELVKRHFRELGRDIQSEDFTVIGVGDMAGDVFGNGMLRSPHIRLLGAFNHQHIFIDPNPDPAAGFAERQRLFDLPRSSWTDYDAKLISTGGGVFERSLKSIALSPEAKAALGIAEDALTPAELIRRLLTAKIDLLFFGGIGTFVKARGESHLEVGDRANDALRVDAETLRATVVGEGANLGVTEKARIAYALAGGRIDTDAIDNSAGVSMSDHEVNIKILLGHAIAEGALDTEEREPLLAQMTDEVAALVLRDNYLQGMALSVAEAQGPAALDRQIRMMRELERPSDHGIRLDRAVEFLPDDDTLAARERLTRPELSVLLAYAKMSLDAELLASDLPDHPAFDSDLAAYFPTELQTRFAAQIKTHPLRREIVATMVANDLVNRAGLTFIPDLAAQTGRSAPDVTRAYRIIRTVFDLPPLWQGIEALDGLVAAEIQSKVALEIVALVEHATGWLLRNNRLDFARETARLGNGVPHLAHDLVNLLPDGDRIHLAARARELAESGIPETLAQRLAGLRFLTSSLEIAELAERTKQPVDRAARIYYAAGARFALDEMRTAARRLPADTPWQKTAIDTVVDDLFTLQTDLAARILARGGNGKDPIAAWATRRANALAPVESAAAELRTSPSPDLAMLVVATRQLRQAVG
ncbi:MAG TPA: NAD-glutamate dehydrogenase [Stellaceae bacterium]|nr:NAD-glutamate dehydrogenase [Stellaceae bacterium]